MAEDEVVTDCEVAGREAFRENLLDELFGRDPRRRRIEPERQQGIDAEGFEAARLRPQGRQLKRRLVGPEEAPGMRLEGDNRQRRTQVPGRRRRNADHGFVAAVDTIEIPDGHGGPAGAVRYGGGVTNDAHSGAYLSAGDSSVKPFAPYRGISRTGRQNRYDPAPA